MIAKGEKISPKEAVKRVKESISDTNIRLDRLRERLRELERQIPAEQTPCEPG